MTVKQLRDWLEGLPDDCTIVVGLDGSFSTDSIECEYNIDAEEACIFSDD